MEDMAGNRFVLNVTTNSSSTMWVTHQVELLYGPTGILFDVELTTNVRPQPLPQSEQP